MFSLTNKCHPLPQAIISRIVPFLTVNCRTENNGNCRRLTSKIYWPWTETTCGWYSFCRHLTVQKPFCFGITQPFPLILWSLQVTSARERRIMLLLEQVRTRRADSFFFLVCFSPFFILLLFYIIIIIIFFFFFFLSFFFFLNYIWTIL